MNDLETQQFLFDLQGYLVIEGVLSGTEVAALVEGIAAQQLDLPAGVARFGGAAGNAGDVPGFLAWGDPFCTLLDHEAIMPVLRCRLGDCFRLERVYGLHAAAGSRGHSLHADYGANAPHAEARSGDFFPHRDHLSLNGFVVVAWSLADAGPGLGGFSCIPGSHKSNFKVPQAILDDPSNASCVVVPPVPAGSVILFSEALVHATAPWCAEHERWSLLYKYCVSSLTWSNQRVQPPENTTLSVRQQKLFHDPGDPHRFFPSLFEKESSP